MRKKNREITDRKEILDIAGTCDSCVLAMVQGEWPYAVPVNFGIEERDGEIFLYFHGAEEGTKAELLRKNPKAAFSMDCSHRLITGEKACQYTMEYESVCGKGIVKFLEGEEKKEGLRVLLRQYEKEADRLLYDPKIIEKTAVYRLEVKEISGKRLKK